MTEPQVYDESGVEPEVKPKRRPSFRKGWTAAELLAGLGTPGHYRKCPARKCVTRGVMGPYYFHKNADEAYGEHLRAQHEGHGVQPWEM